MKADIAASRIIAWNCSDNDLIHLGYFPTTLSLKKWTYSSTLLVCIIMYTFVWDWQR